MASTLKIRGAPAPPAYLVVTNQPFHYDSSGSPLGRAVVAEGFKIPDFGSSASFTSLLAAFKAKERHTDVFSLVDVFREYSIPSTFDGEISEFAFGEVPRRLTIGEMYDLSDARGSGVAGELTTACVSVEEAEATLAFHLNDGRNVMVRAKLSDAELAAYRQHPETFFGVPLQPGARIEDPFALFEFFHGTYGQSDRDRLLDFMKDAPDVEELSHLPREELALIYCERLVHGAVSRKAESEKGGPGQQRP